MIAIFCVDSNNGILFNNRRQSQDKILRKYMLNYIYPHLLWVNSYTRKQFGDFDDSHFIVDDAFLDKTQPEDYCFVENTDISSHIDKIEKIILFRWNRNYPADTFLPIDLSQWFLVETEDFTGYSHDKISKEIYRK